MNLGGRGLFEMRGPLAHGTRGARHYRQRLDLGARPVEPVDVERTVALRRRDADGADLRVANKDWG